MLDLRRGYGSVTAVIAVFLLLAAAVHLSGCRNRTDKKGPTQTEKVNICIGGAPGLAVKLAKELDVFSGEGLDVVLKEYSAGTVAFENMLAGECELTTPAETPIVLKSFERQDFRVLATVTSSDNVTYIVADSSRGITKPKDLKGKRIFVRKGSSNQFWLELFLLKNGVSPKDVKIVFDDIKDVPGAFASGTIDAFCGSDLLVTGVSKKIGKNAVIFNSPGLALSTFNLVAWSSFVSERPETAKKVLSALLKNAETIRKSPQSVVKAASAALKVDEQDMLNILKNYDWGITLSQALLLSFEQEAQWAVRNGLTKKPVIPNYLDLIQPDILKSLKPEAVSVIR